MLDCNMRLQLTIDEINYSECFDENFKLFNKGIEILKKHDCLTEFSEEEREVLEEIFLIINEEDC